MANTKEQAPQTDSQENGFSALNKKSAWLAEVEADATYITEKRFRDHYEEQNREAEKKAREADKEEGNN